MPERNRSGQISFNFTPSQNAALKRAAAAVGMEVTEYVRHVLALHVADFPRDEKPKGNPNIRELRKKSTPSD